MIRQIQKGLPLIYTDTFHSIHSPAPAGPPTLLEDGQCYRGNQLKQSLDGWEVVCLTGKDMHHLKQQDFTSDTHCVYLNTRNQVIRGKTGNGRKPECLYMCCRNLITVKPVFTYSCLGYP